MIFNIHKAEIFAIILISMVSDICFGQNLKNDHLIVGTKIAEPFVISDGNSGYSGIAVDLWIRIAAELNLTYEFREYDLEGLLEAASNGKIDVAVAPLTITSEREKQLDFTQPFFITGLSIATPAKEEGGFIKILDRISSMEFLNVVGILALLLFAIGFITWFFERKKNRGQFGDGITKGIGSSFWWAEIKPQLQPGDALLH